MKTFLISLFSVLLVVAIVIGTIWAVDFFKKPADNTTADVTEPVQASVASYDTIQVYSNTVNINNGQFTAEYNANDGIIIIKSPRTYEGVYVNLYFSTSSSYSGGTSVQIINGTSKLITNVNLYKLIQKSTLKYDTTYYVRFSYMDEGMTEYDNNLFSVRIAQPSDNKTFIKDGSFLFKVDNDTATTGKIHFVSGVNFETVSSLYFSTSSSYSGGVKVDMWDGLFDTFDLNVNDLISSGKLQLDTTYYVRFVCYDYDDYSFERNLFTVRIASIQDVPEPPTKIGYTFTGWYTDEECTEPYLEDTVTSDITLYAGWRANQYTIVFNGNGAENTMSSQIMTYDQSATFSQNTLTREGYNFVGWAISEDGPVVYSDKQSVKNLTATDGTTINLYAVWERIVFTVTFVVDGQQYAKIEVPYGTNLQDVINGNLNTLLFFLPTNSELPYEVTGDISVPVQKTSFGTAFYNVKDFCSQQWVLYTAIGVGVVAVFGITLLIVKKVKR